MELSKTTREQMEEALQLEKESRLSDAAVLYQKLFNSDPGGKDVTGRLLVLYRKLKEYRKELSVLNDAIAAYERKQKAGRDKWIQSHPNAASAGRSILRQLEKGAGGAMGIAKDPLIERWMKRKELVTGRITGKKKKKAGAMPKAGAPPRPPAAANEKRQERKDAAARKKEARERKDAAARQKSKARERKAAEALKRKEQREQKKAEAARQKAEATRQKAEAESHPSLFIVILRYLVSLEKIDSSMKQHMAYLNKHFDKGDFLVSGRQVPRTGGIILARGKDRDAVEQIIKQDPFVKRKMASADIIEFIASQSGKGLEAWLKG